MRSSPGSGGGRASRSDTVSASARSS
jgi:hypothetical protein